MNEQQIIALILHVCAEAEKNHGFVLDVNSDTDADTFLNLIKYLYGDVRKIRKILMPKHHSLAPIRLLIEFNDDVTRDAALNTVRKLCDQKPH